MIGRLAPNEFRSPLKADIERFFFQFAFDIARLTAEYEKVARWRRLSSPGANFYVHQHRHLTVALSFAVIGRVPEF
jgi:hypothetical protein